MFKRAMTPSGLSKNRDAVGSGKESSELYDSENNELRAANRGNNNSAKFDSWIDLGRSVTPSSSTSRNHDEAIERNSCMLEDLLATALVYDAHMDIKHTNINNSAVRRPYIKHTNINNSAVFSDTQDGNSIPAVHIQGTNDILFSPTLRSQIRTYVTHISSRYHHVGFHTFEHASHVMLSATKIVYMLQKQSPFHKMMDSTRNFHDMHRDNLDQEGDFVTTINNHEVEKNIRDLEGTIYDPWIHFAISLSALIHDVGHKGLPNVQLSAESDPLSKKYGSKECMMSYAEWNSLDIGLALLRDGVGYGEFDRVLGAGKKREKLHKIVTDLVLCTDIASKERRDLGMNKWKNACCQAEEADRYRRRPTDETDNTSSHLRKHDAHIKSHLPKLFTPDAAKAISEQIMQVADVSHTMQHFSTFTKWNKHLYHEVLAAHKCGRTLAHHEQMRGANATNAPQEIHHPKENWYDSQIGFFSFYIIPLAERLDACGAFSEDDKFAPLAVQNMEQWREFGREITLLMVKEAECIELPPPMPNVSVNDLGKKFTVIAKFEAESGSQTPPRVRSSRRLNEETDDVSLLESIKTSSRHSRGSSAMSESILKWGKRSSIEVNSSVNAIIPYIFVKQLLDSFQNDVRIAPPSMRVNSLHSAISKYQSEGSIHRHCGALLVVDISGFTHLSQLYPIEDFMMFINVYFTQIIDLVHSFGGEVIKFAGDALFALWTTSKLSVDHVSDDGIKVSETTRAESFHTINIEKCTACAIAINAECNNFKVSKSYSRRQSSVSASSSSAPPPLSDPANATPDSSRSQGEVLYTFQDKNAEYEERGAVLNVHCGVSEGIMAGVDVVANNRAEFFLVGKPLKDVANAEALAAAGDLVVSPSVYYSLTKTSEISSFASKLVFTNVGSGLGLGWESGFQRVSWSGCHPTADDILNYFKNTDDIFDGKRDNAQSLIKKLVETTFCISDEAIESLQCNLMRLLENHRHEAARDVVGNFTAELRRVVVLFISIKFDPSLPENPSDDKYLLENLQNIYSILTESVSSRSGQIRQFMYDDKGTVLIASFGLRGSVLLHPADIALGAAEEAQRKLLDILDVQCSIGITLGNIFCGETGSYGRFEYSLLGPSVNLAARLMAKSKFGQINCDEELKNQTGRRHTFTISGTHKLKGYSKPVLFFMPAPHKSEMEYDEHDDIASFLTQKAVGLRLVYDIVKKREYMCSIVHHQIVLIKGNEVTGKEAFISGVRKELSVSSCSVILEANRCFHDEPFYCFIPIITKALLSFVAPRQRLLSLKTKLKRSSVLSSFLANDALQHDAFPHWADMVPCHLMPYLSLINDFVYRGFPILKSSKEVTLLKDTEKVEKCVEVLCALIMRFLELRQNHGIFCIPEMDSLDIYSKKLLRQILSSDGNFLLIGGVDNSSFPHDEEDTADNIIATILGKDLDVHAELITLELLDMKSTFDLFTWSLRRDFSHEELDIIDQSDVRERIFSICLGTPLATAGLAHTFCTQFKKEFQSLEEGIRVDLLKFTHTFLENTPTDLHEIICYRFDQMKPEEQMLLKVCSVAGFDQFSFSQDLLESVVLNTSRDEEISTSEVHGNFHDSGFGLPSMVGRDIPTSAVSSEDGGYLNYLLQGDNVKKILDSLIAHNFLKEVNVEMSDLGCMDLIMYRFRNSYEQSVINGLMLNDQKKRMHFEVASHYSSSTHVGRKESAGDHESLTISTDSPHITRADWELLNVIAMHFDLADAPIPAMLHYYESSTALSSLGIRDKVHGRLLSAYLMLEKVLQHSSNQDVKIDESDGQRQRVAVQMIRMIAGDHMKDNVAVLTKLTKEHLRLAFKSDIYAFKQSLTVLIKFAQSVGTIEKEGYIFGSELYIQAILLLLLVLDDDALANLTTNLGSILGQLDITYAKVKIRDENSPDDDSSLEDSCLEDFFDIDDLAFSFPAFSGLLTFYRDSPIGANQVQETFLANLFVAVAQEANQMIHVLRTKCILSHIYLKHGNIEKALEECEEIKDAYHHDKHSLELVNTYGMDWVLICVGTMASTYLFKGQFGASLNNIEFLRTQMTKLDEFASSTQAMSKGTISSFYLLLREFESAAEISSGLNATQYNYFFKPVGIFQEELSNRELALSQHTPFDSSACDFDLLSVLTSNSSIDSENQVPRCQAAYNRFRRPIIRSMLHQSAETLSDRGIEAIRAALCATEIRNFELQPNKNADTARKQLHYCQAGLLYLNQTMDQNDANNHERRKNYLMCLYQQADLLFWHRTLIARLMSYTESADDILGIGGTEVDTARQSLDKCKELSKQYDYPFMQILTGKRCIELGLDTSGGEDLIQQAISCLDDVDRAVANSILSRLDGVENSNKATC